jgi:hypothetical protein
MTPAEIRAVAGEAIAHLNVVTAKLTELAEHLDTTEDKS